MNRSTLLAGLFLLAGFLLFTPVQEAKAIGIYVEISFGKPPECKPRGICKFKIGAELKMAGTAGNAVGNLLGNRLEVLMTTPVPQEQLVQRGNKSYLVLDNDVPAEIEREASAKLGARNLMILKGEYEVDFSKNRNGAFTLNVKPELQLRESPTKSSTGKTK